jgi:hypothetical protein
MARLRLLLRPWERWACVALNVLPLPGLGALLAGLRNPHTRLLRNGILQLVLVVLGAWPLIVPGVLGFAWAVWDAVRIGQARIRMPPADAPLAEHVAPPPPKAARR